MSPSKIYPNKPPLEAIIDFESKWGTRYKSHPLIHLVDFVPTQWLIAIASGKNDLASNSLKGEMLSGEKLNNNLMNDGMAHPLIISINGVGDDYKVRLDCGQHRARVAYLLAHIEWLPCFVEVSPGRSPFIRANGDHEYFLDTKYLRTKPDVVAQFMKPSELFSEYFL